MRWTGLFTTQKGWQPKKKGESRDMAYLLIHCETCGGHWEMYHRGDIYDKEQRTCPHCGEKISRQTWDKFIIPALGQVMDANTELLKDHMSTHTALFTFDVIADHLYANRAIQGTPEPTESTCPLMDMLQNISN